MAQTTWHHGHCARQRRSRPRGHDEPPAHASRAPQFQTSRAPCGRRDRSGDAEVQDEGQGVRIEGEVRLEVQVEVAAKSKPPSKTTAKPRGAAASKATAKATPSAASKANAKPAAAAAKARAAQPKAAASKAKAARRRRRTRARRANPAPRARARVQTASTRTNARRAAGSTAAAPPGSRPRRTTPRPKPAAAEPRSTVTAAAEGLQGAAERPQDAPAIPPAIAATRLTAPPRPIPRPRSRARPRPPPSASAPPRRPTPQRRPPLRPAEPAPAPERKVPAAGYAAPSSRGDGRGRLAGRRPRLDDGARRDRARAHRVRRRPRRDPVDARAPAEALSAHACAHADACAASLRRMPRSRAVIASLSPALLARRPPAAHARGRRTRRRPRAAHRSPPLIAPSTGGSGYGEPGRRSVRVAPTALVGEVVARPRDAAGRGAPADRPAAPGPAPGLAQRRPRARAQHAALPHRLAARIAAAASACASRSPSRASAHAAQTAPVAVVNVYRPAMATFFGPGLYGNATYCGQVLTAALHGVAHRKLPCGTLVAIVYERREIVVPVVDRGPFQRGLRLGPHAGDRRRARLHGVRRDRLRARRRASPALTPAGPPMARGTV